MRKKVVIPPKRETKLVFSMRLRPTRKCALQKAAVKHVCAVNTLLEVIIDEWLLEQGFLR
jgi:predicted HicB family RNase H-like nuclease